MNQFFVVVLAAAIAGLSTADGISDEKTAPLVIGETLTIESGVLRET